MKSAPAIDEVRAIRRRISAEFDHSTQALLDHFRALEKLFTDRILECPETRGGATDSAAKTRD